jgi:hypothetical protein
MDDIELVRQIAETTQSITTVGILIYWVYTERRSRLRLSEKILDDWEDLKRARSGKD